MNQIAPSTTSIHNTKLFTNRKRKFIDDSSIWPFEPTFWNYKDNETLNCKLIAWSENENCDVLYDNSKSRYSPPNVFTIVFQIISFHLEKGWLRRNSCWWLEIILEFSKFECSTQKKKSHYMKRNSLVILIFQFSIITIKVYTENTEISA